MKKRVLLPALLSVVLILIIVAATRWPHFVQEAIHTFSPSGAPAPTEQVSPLQEGAPGRPPQRDLFALTAALRPDVKGPIPHVVNRDTPQYSVGQKQVFSLTDLEKDRHFTASTTLRHVSPHAYFYVEDGANLSDDEIRRGADDFENTVLASDRKYFGTEWLPGVDNDPHLSIVMAKIPGVAGYYSSADEYPKAVNPYSNEREVIYISLLGLRPGTREFAAVLSHEYEHAIHWSRQPEQETWISEGTAELASSLAGFSPSSAAAFLRMPDTHLTGWSDDQAKVHSYYGGAYLFMKYLFQHYGGYESIGDFLAERQPGAAGVTAYLKKKGYGVDFDGVFKDWVIANYLDEPGGGRYSYPDDSIKAAAATIKALGETSGSVNQYGTEYYDIEAPSGDLTLKFSGTPNVKLVATDPHSGKRQWWGNRGDAIDSRLTREFDLTRLGAATLKFWAWYDVENKWDFAYVEASTDGGATWRTLSGGYTTGDDPLGNSFGNGLTGQSGNSGGPTWVEETMDLSPYAGKKILLRFEYITDEALNKPGIAIDDISIPELGFDDDAETDAGWTAEGFVRTSNLQDQRYLVQVIRQGDKENSVETVTLDANRNGQAVIRSLGKDLKKATIAISGLTPVTGELAPYRFSLSLDR
ncbi:MAG: immune inhibitor A [Chloroflexi bacterium]|nr:immune inhibitor A [Chloroflexota bacterium]